MSWISLFVDEDSIVLIGTDAVCYIIYGMPPVRPTGYSVILAKMKVNTQVDLLVLNGLDTYLVVELDNCGNGAF